MSSQVHSLSVGRIRAHVASDGLRPASAGDIARLYGLEEAEIRSAYAEIGRDADAVENHFNILILQTEGRTVLADTGFGPVGAPDFGRLHGALETLDIDTDDVDTVIITHAHGDHCVGLADRDGAPVFPSARILVNRREWQHWYENRNAQGPAFSALEAVSGRVELFDDGDRLAPGVHAMAAYGHSPGHTALFVESEGARLLHAVDTLHREVQFAHPEWSPGFDLSTDESVPTRRSMLSRCADEGLTTLFYHLRFPGLGVVRRAGDAFAWEPLEDRA